MRIVSCFMWRDSVILVMDDGFFWCVRPGDKPGEFTFKRLVHSQLVTQFGEPC